MAISTRRPGTVERFGLDSECPEEPLKQKLDFVTHKLRWSDVSPDQRHFDELKASQLVLDFLRDQAPKLDQMSQGSHSLDGWLDRLLVQNFGVWISGWRSGEDGGPVTSDFSAAESPAQQTLAVVQAVKQWIAFLQAVDQIIKDFPFSSVENIESQIEMVAARVIPMVAQATEAQDAWYKTCALALNWYLESYGFGHTETRSIVERTFSGEFESWVEPKAQEQNKAAKRVAQKLGNVPRAQQVPDSLERWLSVREGPTKEFQHFPESYPLLICDGHTNYIRNKEKDDRMVRALGEARKWAGSEGPLTIEVLKEWQKLVLDKNELSLRSTDAFAKRGRERYGVKSLPRFGNCLQEANMTELSPAWRAAMAYLDICFFHPFEDGNARLARLTMDAILLRAGYALNYVEPVFVVARAAEDSQGGTLLALTVSDLMGSV